MKATAFEFRFRVWIAALLYVVGFVVPWPGSTRPGGNHVWAWLAEQLFRIKVLPLQQAFEAIAIVACILALAGASLRMWGTAHLGPDIVRDTRMHADSLVTTGPYRFLRNPLYVGSWLTAAAVSILMPHLGALLFLVALGLFELRLAMAERAFLSEQVGASYRDDGQSATTLGETLPAPMRRQWVQSILTEIYPIGIAVCFLIFCWNYDVRLLTRCVLICAGVTMVVRALLPRRG